MHDMKTKLVASQFLVPFLKGANLQIALIKTMKGEKCEYQACLLIDF